MHRRMERRCFQGSVRLPEASSSSAQRRARLSPPSLNPLHIGSCEQPQVKHCSRRAPTTSRNCQRARTQTALHQQEGHRHARPPTAEPLQPGTQTDEENTPDPSPFTAVSPHAEASPHLPQVSTLSRGPHHIRHWPRRRSVSLIAVRKKSKVALLHAHRTVDLLQELQTTTSAAT